MQTTQVSIGPRASTLLESKKKVAPRETVAIFGFIKIRKGRSARDYRHSLHFHGRSAQGRRHFLRFQSRKRLFRATLSQFLIFSRHEKAAPCNTVVDFCPFQRRKKHEKAVSRETLAFFGLCGTRKGRSVRRCRNFWPSHDTQLPFRPKRFAFFAFSRQEKAVSRETVVVFDAPKHKKGHFMRYCRNFEPKKPFRAVLSQFSA
jgi:hypothetical protein